MYLLLLLLLLLLEDHIFIEIKKLKKEHITLKKSLEPRTL